MSTFKRPKAEREQLQKAIDDFLRVPAKFRQDEARTGNNLGFSPFDPRQAKQSVKLTGKFMKIANNNTDDPINKVLEAATEESKTVDPELVRWALMSFITHHPAARDNKLRIPSLVKRAPELSVPKHKKKPFAAPGPIVSDQPVVSAASVPGSEIESYIDWYREDPNLHEHHEHWHVIYQGVPDSNDPDTVINKDRHGELFVYMHRQMLARLDAERQAIGIPLVEPLDDYRAPIQEGYSPNDQLVDTSDNTPFGKRDPNSVLGDVDGTDVTIDNMEQQRQEIKEIISNGVFSDGSEITMNALGDFIEPGLHANGHVAIAYINDPSRATEAEVDPGVMYNPRVAARDPAFWRWHRHVDNLISEWENTLPPNDFSSDSPPGIKAQDIILAFKDKLPISHGETQDQEATDFGESQFGGDNFDSDVSSNEYVTDKLETKMKRRNWVMVEDSGATQEIEYLFPREYYYFFRVENSSDAPLDATFRVFLVAEELADSRRHWIELDKFKESIPANSKKVVCRDCDMSSVVRQPPQKTEEELDDVITQPGTEDSYEKQFCDCGWPFHLLIPRGNSGGVKYKLLLFITDWSQDEVPRLSRCGSISFCGAEGASEKYPDSKPMGFPFNRPFKDGSYVNTFDGLDNVTIRDVLVDWVDDFPEIKDL